MRRYFLWLIICLLGLGSAAVQAQDETTIPATLYQTVNVRGGPGTRYEIVGQVSAGDTVEVLGRADGASRWLQVLIADGSVGWIPSYLLILNEDPAILPIVGALNGESDGGEVIITAYGTVNVRNGPSILEQIVDQLEAGDTAQARARSNERNDWLYIENQTLAGWVAYFTVDVAGNPNSLPLRVPDAASSDLIHPTRLIRTRFNTRLHAEPGVTSATVGIVPFATEVTPLARSEDNRWLYVASGDLVGWAAADLFALEDGMLDDLPLYSPDAAYELDSLAQSARAPLQVTAEATLEPIMIVPEATDGV